MVTNEYATTTCPICLEDVDRKRKPYQCPRCCVEICYPCWERDMTTRPNATCPTCRHGSPLPELQMEAKKHYSYGVCTALINFIIFPYIGIFFFLELLVACVVGKGGYQCIHHRVEHPRTALSTMETLKMASIMSSIFSVLSMGIALQYTDPTPPFQLIFSIVFGASWGALYMHIKSAKRWIEMFRLPEERVLIV